MVSVGSVVGLIFATFFALLVLFLAYVLVKLGAVLAETQRLVEGITERTVPLLGEVTGSVTQVNAELARVDSIAANVQTMTGNVSALTSVFAATLGGPVIKVAAFSYGVRRAAAARQRADIDKAVRGQLKEQRKDRRKDRRTAARQARKGA